MSSKKHAPKTDLELAIAEIREEEKLAIKALKQLTEEEIKNMEKESSSSTTIKKRKKAALSQIRAHRHRMATRIRALKKGITTTPFGDFNSPKPKPMHAQGPFDSFGKLKGYEAAGQSAGNRIERVHPGFYNAVRDLPGILNLIFDIYGSAHQQGGGVFYEIHGNDYFDKDAYKNLLTAIQYKYGVEVLV